MMINKTVPITFKSSEAAVRIAGGIYIGSAYTPVREYVSNGIDAGATCVEVWTDAKTGRVYIEDDGTGITAEKLERMPQELGASDKRPNNIGQWATGLLSYQGIGSRLEIITRTPGMNGSMNYLRMQKGNPQATLGQIPQDSAEQYGGPFRGKGTRIIISDVSARTIERLNIGVLKRELSKAYNPLLHDGEVVIALRSLDDAASRIHYIEEVQYSGSKVLDMPLELVDDGNKPILFERADGTVRMLEPDERPAPGKDIFQGNMRFHLFCNPSGTTENVTMYHNGVKICSLNELLQDDVLCSGKITGYIDENFLPLNSEKTAYNVTTDAKSCHDQGKLLEERILRNKTLLKKKLDECVQQFKEAEQGELKNTIERILAKTYHQIGSFTKRQRTASVPTESPRHNPRTRKTPYPVSFKPFDINEDSLRVTFNPMYRHIEINVNHPDYKRFVLQCQDVKEKHTYIVQQVSKGAAMADYVRELNKEDGNANVVLKMPETLPFKEMQHVMERESEIFGVMAKMIGIFKKLPLGKP